MPSGAFIQIIHLVNDEQVAVYVCWELRQPGGSLMFRFFFRKAGATVAFFLVLSFFLFGVVVIAVPDMKIVSQVLL